MEGQKSLSRKQANIGQNVSIQNLDSLYKTEASPLHRVDLPITERLNGDSC